MGRQGRASVWNLWYVKGQVGWFSRRVGTRTDKWAYSHNLQRQVGLCLWDVQVVLWWSKKQFIYFERMLPEVGLWLNTLTSALKTCLFVSLHKRLSVRACMQCTMGAVGVLGAGKDEEMSVCGLFDVTDRMRSLILDLMLMCRSVRGRERVTEGEMGR